MDKHKIEKLAAEVVKTHGMHLAAALDRPDGAGFNAGNLVALLQVFGERLVNFAPEKTGTLFIAPGGRELLRVGPTGFFVNGERVEGGRAVHDAFVAWLAASGFPAAPESPK